MTGTTLVVVTPRKKVLMVEVESVMAPGTEGYLGILSGHAPLLTALKPGVLYYRRAGGKTERMAVAGGFMEVAPNRIIILADSAELSTEIDVDRARQAKIKAQELLREQSSPRDKTQAELAVQVNEARLKAAGVNDDVNNPSR